MKMIPYVRVASNHVRLAKNMYLCIPAGFNAEKSAEKP